MMRFLSGRNLDVLVFSVLCHTAEESGLYSCPLTPVPSSSELRGKRQIEASSDPFHVTTSLPIFFPYLLVLISYLMIYLSYQIAASFYRDLLLLVLYTTASPSDL